MGCGCHQCMQVCMSRGKSGNWNSALIVRICFSAKRIYDASQLSPYRRDCLMFWWQETPGHLNKPHAKDERKKSASWRISKTQVWIAALGGEKKAVNETDGLRVGSKTKKVQWTNNKGRLISRCSRLKGLHVWPSVAAWGHMFVLPNYLLVLGSAGWGYNWLPACSTVQ